MDHSTSGVPVANRRPVELWRVGNRLEITVDVAAIRAALPGVEIPESLVMLGQKNEASDA